MRLLRRRLDCGSFTTTIGVNESLAQTSVPSANSATSNLEPSRKAKRIEQAQTWTRSQWAAQRKGGRKTEIDSRAAKGSCANKLRLRSSRFIGRRLSIQLHVESALAER